MIARPCAPRTATMLLAAAWAMGPSHAGHAWGTMGSGWHGGNGNYGMAFPFTTA